MAFVRVTDPVSKAQVTVSEEWAESAGLKEVKGADALDHLGRPRPPTTSKGEPFEAPDSGTAATDAEEAPQ